MSAFFFSVRCFASCICTVLWQEGFQLPSNFGWPWVPILVVSRRTVLPTLHRLEKLSPALRPLWEAVHLTRV